MYSVGGKTMKKNMKSILSIVSCTFMLIFSMLCVALSPQMSVLAKGKESIYALTGKTRVCRENGTDKEYYKSTSYYSYNDTGMLIKETHKGNDNITIAYSYDDNNNIVKIKERNKTSTIKYDTFGKVKNKTIKHRYGNDEKYKYTLNDDGNIISKKCVSSEDQETVSYKVDKKGHFKTSTVKYNGDEGTRYKYSYDSKGYLIKSECFINGSTDAWEIVDYENSYKDDLLSEQTSYSNVDMAYTVDTFEYKRIKVDAKLAQKVKDQQWAILNQGLNNAFYSDELR